MCEKQGNEQPTQPFKEGDVVVLKSGGPLMTVLRVARDIHTNEAVVCCWFDDTKALRSGTFSLDAIRVATKGDRVQIKVFE